MSKYIYVAERDDYLTPPEFITELLKKYKIDKFDCDVCCTKFNIPARLYYTLDGLYSEGTQKLTDNNGLTGEWFDYNWCNPPFGICDEFVEKAAWEQKQGNTTFMLIPARTETKYWHDYILDENGGTTRRCVEVKFLRKGLKFLHPETDEEMGVYKNALALVIFWGIYPEC